MSLINEHADVSEVFLRIPDRNSKQRHRSLEIAHNFETSRGNSGQWVKARA